MKVLLLAFGNPDNVITLSKHLSARVDFTLAFAVSGDKFRQGVMDADISELKPGLNIDQSKNKSLLSDGLRIYIDENIRLWFLKTPSMKFLFSKGGLTNYSIVKKAAKQISGYDYDVVHFNGTSGFLLYLLKHTECKRRIWTLHDYKPHTGEENRTGVLLNRIYTKFDIRYIQHYSYLKNEFAKYYGIDSSHVNHVYSGAFDVYESFFPEKTEVPQKYILFFGRFSKYKGIETLVSAYIKAKNSLDGAELVLAGAGNTGADIPEGAGIHVLNRYIKPSELVYLVKNSICVVTPYTDSTHSGVVMTSYVFNKPVISSDVGGIREVVHDGETGFLFSNGSEDELKNRLIKMCEDTGMRNKMSANISDMKNNGILNWERISEQMAAIYGKLDYDG
ncbi:MAG: glycosyltransferase family 4 protein [Bacteroidetes bacterium]|nr:glycosyltransferase family 4 protein [Bacteroidota bacterium]